MSQTRTYLDHNATAPLRPEARAALIAALDVVGNASSVHAEGRRARGIVEDAREAVAALVGAKPEEVVFTSGATEANNWVMRAGWDRLSVGATEHESVLAPARAAHAEVKRAELKEVMCDGDGLVRIASASGWTGGRTVSDKSRALLSLQFANAETGVVQPIADAAAAAHEAGFLFHCDAVQAVGRLPVDFKQLGLDFLSISAHKLGGPKGVGALVIRDGLDLPALLSGGGQERRRRSGTENVAAIAGFGAAAVAARAELGSVNRLALMRDRLEAGVRDVTPEAVVIGKTSPRLPNTSCLAMPGADASTLLIKLDLKGIAVSAGSACSSGKIGGSHVLAAMGVDAGLARAAIRISLGWSTRIEDVERFVEAWTAIHRAGTRSSRSNAAGRRPPGTSEPGGRLELSAPAGLAHMQAGE